MFMKLCYHSENIQKQKLFSSVTQSQEKYMATLFRVAGMQMNVTAAVDQNIATIRRAIERASAAGADILLTPEGSLSGYSPVFDSAAVEAGLAQVTRLAREKGLALALGTCYQESDGLVYNQIRFYNRNGAYLGFHSKILRCGTMATPSQGEINDYATSPLRTFVLNGLTVGGLICNDLWANPSCTPMPDPHLTHKLAVEGARIIFHAVNGGRDGSPWSREVAWPYHEANLRMRAEADKVWIVTADCSHPPEIPCSAPSGVVDPTGSWACRTSPQGEQFFIHTIEVAL
jgi:predicted amidohydrolase